MGVVRLIFLFGLVALTFAEIKQIRVKKNEDVLVQSPKYPEPSVPGETITWQLTTDDDAEILLQCDDIRTSKSVDCEAGYVQIVNAKGEGKYCDGVYDLRATSRNSKMSIDLVLKRSLGVFRCIASGIDKEANKPQQEEDPPKEGNINLKPGDPAFEIKLSAPKHTHKVWEITTDPKARLSLFCTTIGITAGGRCHEASFVVSSGNKGTNVCQYRYHLEFIGTNEMRIQLSTTILDVKVDCIVQAITGSSLHQYKNIVSYEIDSREHGMTAGSKQTNCPCGSSNKQKSRVIHGTKASDHEFPFVVSLLYNNWHMCGGSIITAIHVLSAAHCTENMEASKYQVLAGQNVNVQPFTGQVRRVVQIVDHERYDSKNSFINDITILVLNQKFEFGRNVLPVCLPTPRHSHNLNHKYVTLMGWGIAQELGKDRYTPKDLQKTHMRVVDYPTCNAIYNWAFTPSSNPNKFCTWASIRDSCSGDSGGPLVWLDPETNRYTQMGLVSFGRGCNTDYPKINTYVKYYYDWIQNVVRKTMPGMNTCEKV